MELGRGALSTVRLSHGLAVKITRKPILVLLKQTDIAAREKEALEAAIIGGSSLYLAQIRHAAQTASQLFLYMDAALAGGISVNVRQLIRGWNDSVGTTPGSCRGVLPAFIVVRLAECMASALCHLHARRIAHRDVKAENIVLAADAAGNDARFVLIDFGAARCLESGDERCTSLVGTLAYLAPEVLSRNGHGLHVDWWSLGVLLYEAKCGKHPFLPDDLSDGDNSCECGHFELSEAQKAMAAERLTESLMACCEEGEEKEEGAILVSLVVPALRDDPIERADGSHAWAADHAPSATCDLGAMLQTAIKRIRDHAAAKAAGTLLHDDDEEEADDESEYDALLERAEAIWRKSSDEWQPKFACYGPLIDESDLEGEPPPPPPPSSPPPSPPPSPSLSPSRLSSPPRAYRRSLMLFSLLSGAAAMHPAATPRIVRCGGGGGGGSGLQVTVHELVQAPEDSRDQYGSRQWPAALYIASYLYDHPEIVKGRTVLELGCGNGLVSLAATAIGASKVIATDYRDLPLQLVDSAAEDAGYSDRLTTCLLDIASPMPSPAVISTRNRASRIPPSDITLPSHDVLIAADLGYSQALAWRLGERCGQSLAAGARVIVAESRQMPFCRRAFSEALGVHLGGDSGVSSSSVLRLEAVSWDTPAEEAEDGAVSRHEVAVGGGGEEAAPMWVLDYVCDRE